jgi:Spy/CpxP family protein refolding chaperone
MGGPRGGGFGDVMRDLTDVQREQVRAIREKHAERLRPVMERARNARQALEAAVESGNTANLQALSIEVGNAETELAFAQAQVQSEVFAVLTPDQKQKIAERRKEMEQRRAEMEKRRQNRTQ